MDGSSDPPQEARALVYGAAAAMDAARPFDTHASIAKLVASEAATWIAERALHLQGAQGYMLDSPAQRYYRDCKVVEWGEGVNELQREMIFEAAVAGYRPRLGRPQHHIQGQRGDRRTARPHGRDGQERGLAVLRRVRDGERQDQGLARLFRYGHEGVAVGCDGSLA